MTWTCHVCGDERPDHVIAVAKSTRTFGNGIEVQQNVRYCGDREACARGAREINWMAGVDGE